MTTQPNWNRRVGSEELIAVIKKENAVSEDKYVQIFPDLVDRGILSNSQNKPKYSLKVSLFFGFLILLSMLTGVAVGMWGNHGH